jgi:Flp pilus assembly protein TadD
LADTYYELGVAYLDKGSFRAAIPELARAVEINPSDAVFRNALGFALMLDRRLDEAMRELQEAARLDPRFSEAKNNLASIYMLKGDLEKARVTLQEVLKDPFYPTPEFVYFNLARIYEQQGKIPQAIEEYQRALDIRPEYVDAHNNLGILYLHQGKVDLAIKAFREAIRLDPQGAIYRRNLGMAYLQAGNREEARRAFEKALELQPDSPHAENTRKLLEQLKR